MDFVKQSSMLWQISHYRSLIPTFRLCSRLVQPATPKKDLIRSLDLLLPGTLLRSCPSFIGLAGIFVLSGRKFLNIPNISVQLKGFAKPYNRSFWTDGSRRPATVKRAVSRTSMNHSMFCVSLNHTD